MDVPFREGLFRFLRFSTRTSLLTCSIAEGYGMIFWFDRAWGGGVFRPGFLLPGGRTQSVTGIAAGRGLTENNGRNGQYSIATS